MDLQTLRDKAQLDGDYDSESGEESVKSKKRDRKGDSKQSSQNVIGPEILTNTSPIKQRSSS